MRVSIIGGGAWGATIARVLADNGYSSLIYDINEEYVNIINKEHIHPIFKKRLDPKYIKATTKLELALENSNVLVTAVPTAFLREVLKDIYNCSTSPLTIINISKGIEPDTGKLISEIVEEELKNNLHGYVCLTGPSHAEEVIIRQITLLVAASKNRELVLKTQKMFSNKNYLRVYTTNDVIGAEVGGSAKNAIAVISGAAYGMGLLENARAALITRGMIEVVKVVELLGGEKDTAYGLTGLGDLIVTASSFQSRNFQAGKLIGEGKNLEEIYSSTKQTIEGIRSIVALNNLSKKHNVELPIINSFYYVIDGKKNIKQALYDLINRSFKDEQH